MLSDRNKEMNIRDLLNKMDTLAEAGEIAPNSIVPTHFHKSNLGTTLPLMMTQPGIFWWEGSNNDSEGGRGGGRSIQRWQGNTENRSKFNPASVDGIYVNGKPVEFPEGVTWRTYKPAEVDKPPIKDPEKQDTKPVVRPQADDGHTAKLNALALQLQDKLNSKKTDKQDVKPAPDNSTVKWPTTPDEIKAFQTGRKDPRQDSKTQADGNLAVDGIIGSHTYQALVQAGAKPPADFRVTSYKEGLEDIANSLMESFGYDTELDEYSLDQFGKDVGAGARGIGNGLTFGYGDNLVAGAKAGLGIEKDYKTALGKEMANTARAKANSSSAEFNNPLHNTWIGNKLGAEKTFKVNPYDVGDIVGTVATPIPGGIAARGLGKGTALAVDAGLNFGTAVGAGIAKNWHDEKRTGLTQELVDRLAKMDPAYLKDIQTSLKIPVTGKLDPATLDAVGKQAQIAKQEKEKKESTINQNNMLSESEKMSALKNRLARINEGEPGANLVARPIEKILGIGGRDLAKMTDKEIANLIGHGGSLERVGPQGIIMPKVEPKVKPTVSPKVEPSVKNTNTNTATGGTSSKTSAGGNAGVKGSGNSTNTITNNPVININIGAKELATAARAVEHDAGPLVAKEFEAVVKTGDKSKIGSWWERNKGRVKWTSGTLAVLSAVGLAGLLFGGKDDAQDTKPDPTVTPTDPTVTPTDPTVTPTDPTVTPTDPTVTPVKPDDKQDIKPDPEVEALIQQMQEIMLGYESDESSEWSQATSNAQSLIDQAKGNKNTSQIDSDRKAARRIPTTGSQSTKPTSNTSSTNLPDELEISNNKKDPTRVSKGTVIGPR
jgi:hypothetical protein